MSADFTPNMQAYKNPHYFRFWCQKVLPLVYDDSLSYYELLCKVVKYLNDVIEDSDAVKENVQALKEAYDQLQAYVNEYFDNLDLQDEVDKKLDEMAAAGIFDHILNLHLTSNYINVVAAGAYNDGVHETSDALNEIFSTYKGGTFYFPRGIYLIDKPIIHTGTGPVSSIILDNATLKATNTLDYMMLLGDMSGNDNEYVDFSRYYISGMGVFDLNNLAKCGLQFAHRARFCHVVDTTFFNLPENGQAISLPLNESYVCTFDNIYVYNQATVSGSVGIYSRGKDSFYSNIQITGCQTGISLQGGGNQLQNVHIYTEMNVAIQGTNQFGVDVNSSDNEFTNLYIDNYRWGVRTLYGLNIANYFYYIPQDSNTENIIDCGAVRSIIGINHTINGIYINHNPAASKLNIIGLYLANQTDEYQVGTKKMFNATITNHEDALYQIYGDELFNIRNNAFSRTLFRYANQQILTGYYLIGWISKSSGVGIISIGVNNDVFADVCIKTARNDGVTLPLKIIYRLSNTGSNYGIAIGSDPVTFINKTFYPVYLKVNAAQPIIETEIEFRGLGESNFYLKSYRTPADAVRYFDSDLNLKVDLNFEDNQGDLL